MKRTILAAAAAVALVAVAAPAQANSGVVHSGEFWDDIGGMRQAGVQNQWGVTGTTTTQDANDKTVSYDSAGDFTRDICWVFVHYHYNGTYWIAQNYGDGTGKAQIGCPGSGGQWWYGIGATHA